MSLESEWETMTYSQLSKAICLQESFTFSRVSVVSHPQYCYGTFLCPCECMLLQFGEVFGRDQANRAVVGTLVATPNQCHDTSVGYSD